MPRTGLLMAALAMISVAVSGCGGGSLAPSSPPEQQFDGPALPPTPAPDFTLLDIDGKPASLAALRGRVTIVAFLYSDCTACTLLAQQIRGALDELSTPPAVLIVSVDPPVDTPARVRAFLTRTSLTGRVRYLVAPRRALEAAWSAYRVRVPANGREAFERAAPVLLIDKQGRERVIYEEEQLTPEALAHDVDTLAAR